MAAMIGIAAVGMAMNFMGNRSGKRAQREMLKIQKEQQAQQRAMNKISMNRERMNEIRRARVQEASAQAAMAQSGVTDSSSMEGVMSSLTTGIAERSSARMLQNQQIEASATLQTNMARQQSKLGTAQQISNFGGSLIQTALSSDDFAKFMARF